MKLICDDKVQTYFWVDDNDETRIVSPRFDYVEDAVDWHKKIEDDVYEKLEKTWTKTTG